MLRHATTLQDVADLAQVSVSTASRALRGQSQVAEETRQRVESAARQLGYRGYGQDRQASDEDATRNGVRRTSNPIPGLERLVVIAEMGSHRFFGELLLELFHIGQERSFETVVHTDYTVEDASALLHVVAECDADAIVLVTWRDLTRADAKLFGDSPVPVILINRYVDGSTFSVGLDDFAAGVQAANYLYHYGHRRIGHLMGNPSVPSIRQRTVGFRTGLERLGIYDPELFIPIDQEDRFRVIQEAMDRLLKRENRCTAIWGWNDAATAEALTIARARGLCVPEDLSLMGFDRAGTFDDLEITTFDFRMREMGLAVVFLLEGYFQNGLREPAQILLTPRLIPGKTTGPVPPSTKASTKA